MDNSHNGNERLKNINVPVWFLKTRQLIYYALGVIEILLGFRFIFKLLGANSQNGFVSFLYSAARIFMSPFSGIFNSFTSTGLAAKSVFEPAAIIGMIVYAVLAWGLVGLIQLVASRNGH